ncbi:MAG: hypothetical protein CMH65_10030 [Nevskiales bacterium]|nr:hypothetical protein [Nevskiales bacterium]
MQQTGPAQLFVWSDGFVWTSWRYAGNRTHRYAANLVLSAGDQPLLLEPEGQPAMHCKAALCAVGAKRRIDATDIPFLSLNLDPDTPAALTLHRLLGPGVIRTLSDAFASAYAAPTLEVLGGHADVQQVRKLTGTLIHAVGQQLGATEDVQLDDRIRRVANRLRQQSEPQVCLSELAELAGLSPSHLMHLFREQLGLSMRNFLLWQKMRQALRRIVLGEPLTQVAHQCGFADSAHLTRTFQAFYAIRPSLLRDRNYVQAVYLE